MGYTTDFSGYFRPNKPLTDEQVAYLKAFNHTRRVKRNAKIVATLPDPVREAVGLPVGKDGGYFVGAGGEFGQDGSFGEKNYASSESVVDHNKPPTGQSGLWCQWTVDIGSDCKQVITWDGGEKFYNYVEWLEYLIEHFFKPWGIKLNGEVSWYGSESDDMGKIVVKNNKISVGRARIEYDFDE